MTKFISLSDTSDDLVVGAPFRRQELSDGKLA